MKLLKISMLGLALSAGLVACGGSTKVTRTDVRSTEGGDLSGYWNDIDARLVSDEMIKDCMSSAWLPSYNETHAGQKPVIKLMGVLKRTDDRNVNTMLFTKKLERALLNSGRARVVASYGQDAVNEVERIRQSKHASDETAKSQQMETGADFTLQTIVNSQNETNGGGKAVRVYMVNMELVNVETNEKVWIGEKSIRKVIDQPSSSW